jgi:hypothetical protein
MRMNHSYRNIIVATAVLTLLFQGCAPAAAPAIVPPTAPALDLTIALPATATPPAVEEAAVQQQAPASSASLYGMVWEDEDRDGLQDWEERGIPGVGVSLLTSARTLAGTATTNGNGAYQFKDVVPGDYFVSLVPPAGYVFSPQDQGVNELVDSDTNTTTAETVPVTLVAGENGLTFTTGVYSPTATPQPRGGTVKPPPPQIYVCAPGNYSLSAVSTVKINALAPGYCVRAYLWKHGFAIGQIPGGAGRILADVTFVEFFYQDTFVYQYTGEPNSVQVCYSLVSGSGQIYFFDHYGPRFGNPHSGQPGWVPLETTVSNGIACAAAQTSGAYALIGK